MSLRKLKQAFYGCPASHYRRDPTAERKITAMSTLIATAAGEEFRNDVRKKLSTDTLAALTRLDPVRSTLAVAQTFILLALVIGLAMAY